ncbi:O-antigen ligase family protein [Nocardioides sp.]|uniref:O-antigen ligase family protein n=1 Tax=Nocardioides sp. TaxID=35761 RepID=UPI003D14B960
MSVQTLTHSFADFETTAVRRPRRTFIRGRLDEFWPLTLYFYLYPLWWVLGLSKLIIFFMAVPMLVSLVRHHDLRVPRGFGFYLLFLMWFGLGVTMLWVQAPGTDPKHGLGPLIGFTFRILWYASVTIACLYVLNADRTRLTAVRLGRMLAFLFLITISGGLLGLAMPTLDFPSLLELGLPKGAMKTEFLNTIFHPRVVLNSEFLGYSQPRVTAPFSYPNTWGNAVGLLLPFFIATWFGRAAGWRRFVSPFILLLAVVPIVYSLNRGLWLGLAVSVTWVTVRRLWAGDFRALIAATAAVMTVAGALLLTPLGQTITTRLATPQSDDRRQDTATEVIRSTWDASPILGYGGTRNMVANFNSLAGGNPECHQCSAPPLGTQGFLWGLIFMTGFVGAVLLVGFLMTQFWINMRVPTTLGLVTSTVVLASVFYFLFYDSLDVPMLVTMMAIGLSAREHSPPPLPPPQGVT